MLRSSVLRSVFATAILGFGMSAAVAQSESGAGEDLQEITYAVTTTNITTGHAAQSSIPVALGLWEEEGLDVEVIGVQGATAGIQQLIAGNVDFATVGVDALLNALAAGADVTAVYTYAREPIYSIVVPADSDIISAKDLEGKTIGVPNMTTGAVPYARVIVSEAGLDPDEAVNWLAVGFGAPAANAFRQDDIQAWAAWDTIIAALENGGFEFRHIVPDWAKQMPGNVMITRTETIKENPELVAKVARGLAKATLFGLTNPEAAIRNHWEMYPETKPQGGEPEQAMKEAKHIYNSRFNLMDLEEGAQWGENIPAAWERAADLAKTEELIPEDFDVTSAYTNEFIDEINDFDADAVVEAAKTSEW